MMRDNVFPADNVLPGALVKYTTTDNRHLFGLVIARVKSKTLGLAARHIIVWCDGTMSEHIYCWVVDHT